MITPKTQQYLVLIGFSTLCALTLLAFITLAHYAASHDGTFGDQFMQALQTMLQWGIAAIAGMIGIHTVVQRGLLGQPPAPTPPATPPTSTPADGPASGS